MRNICAVSTPVAEGGISVIRISGDKAIEIAGKVFRPLSCGSVENMEGYTCAYGKIVDGNGREVDDGVLTVFRAPRSYTGENVCEISCHGGVYVTKKVLRLCIENGAELAQRGEFTKRAFLNGKLSLTQAEGVMETISAQGEYALNSANLTKEGRLFKLISEMSQKFVTILGELGAWVDYPEEDLPEVSEDNLRASLKSALGGLDRILADYDSGMILKNGVDTVIAGKPNVGKSTLMNMLLGFDRSIVTDVAGTTRDVIEESAKLGELVLKLSDTAGIHETDDQVEKIGVDIAKKKLENAMLVIEVFDISRELDGEDRELLEYVKGLGKKVIIVLNKSDLECRLDRSEFKGYADNVIEISAKLDEGRGALQSAAEGLLGIGGYDADSTIFANERQKACAERARKYLALALESLDYGETLDAVTVMIDNGANALLELTGEKATEAVVDEVFAKFCVGK
ncbi:tRNA uridine-5-carboxymethylaminomethyl(34) synthesis GTPase MnmE [Ruminococcus sp.]|uniref:tRNA uridine-5-carboxymethylaminomethyl(34) synthesis GTPase MnmE n=1 Tax=Ruminococcus sp. TaxID=41978 RepID=UPI0025DB2870|nr:tRNA uridine-5-carboxymethylaminomethyl(34) synthesis GTPase MnmE [Ruminococcus sp.]